jgi:hypothetical protein
MNILSKADDFSKKIFVPDDFNYPYWTKEKQKEEI